MYRDWKFSKVDLISIKFVSGVLEKICAKPMLHETPQSDPCHFQSKRSKEHPKPEHLAFKPELNISHPS